jgi:hypothetical protein
MSAGVFASAVALCAFALGCAVLHAARAQAAAVTPLLAASALAAGLMVLLGASLASAPDDPMSLDDITVYNAA